MLDSLTRKVKVKDVCDLDKIGRQTYFVNVYTLMPKQALLPSARLLPVTFRGRSTQSTVPYHYPAVQVQPFVLLAFRDVRSFFNTSQTLPR